MGSYVPHTDKDRREMLAKIGISSLSDLYSGVPEELKVRDGLPIPDGMSEMEARKALTKLASENKVLEEVYRGAGAYRHYIPAIVDQVAQKESFLTAYTPYQAEISQGVLQSIFEYQTDICVLTGMDVSNAGVYDGAEAAAEGVMMMKDRKRTKILVSAAVHPDHLSVIRTYAFGSGTFCDVVPEKDYRTDLSTLLRMLDDTTACVYLEQPNFYGSLEDVEKAAEIIHEKGAKLVLGVNPIASAVLKTAREYGADAAVGEGQPLGMPLSFGGPYLGFMATTDKDVRRLPGRIVGETTDRDGKRGYVLTLQAREQHIRREKASSNICSNEALAALRAGVYCSAMGPEGLKKAASQSLSNAHYLARILAEAGFKPALQGEFFHEFVTASPVDPMRLEKYLEKNGILMGLPLHDKHAGEILWCATEMNTKEEMDRLARILLDAKEVLS